MYDIRNAQPKEAVRIASLARTSLQQGVDGSFKLNSQRILDHVVHIIDSNNGFAQVLTIDSKIVGFFLGELVQHAYADGYIASDVGVYIEPGHRGRNNFNRLLNNFLKWKDSKPDVLLTKFTIGQLGPTTPYIRHMLKECGFTQGDEGYYIK